MWEPLPHPRTREHTCAPIGTRELISHWESRCEILSRWALVSAVLGRILDPLRPRIKKMNQTQTQKLSAWEACPSARVLLCIF